MEITARSCLLAFALCCNLTAAIIQKIVVEKELFNLKCPQPVEGQVKWSRERNGTKIDILTTGDQDMKHIPDPSKKYSSSADKSLNIKKADLSDTGRYCCNNEPAVDVRVIPSGTKIQNGTKGRSITLSCPPGGPDVHTWTSDAGEIKQDEKFHVSTRDNTLTIRNVKPRDTGLYYCGGKPAVYLNVTKGDQSKRGKTTSTTTQTALSTTTTRKPATSPTATGNKDTTKTTTSGQDHDMNSKTTSTTTQTALSTTTTRKPTTSPTATGNKDTTKTTTSGQDHDTNKLALFLGIAALCVLVLVAIIITVVVCFRKCRSNKEGGEEEGHIYHEIEDRLGLKPTNNPSNVMEATYSTISDPPMMDNRKVTNPPNESHYSCIGDTFVGENKKGLTRQPDNTYFLLQKPKTLGSNNNLTSVV